MGYERKVIVESENRDTGERLIFENSDPKSGEGIKITFQVEKQVSTEPNVAYLELFNLSYDTREKLNFRKDVKQLKFGNKINIRAGYGKREEDAKRIFSGVVVSAVSTKEGPLYVTRLTLRNIFYELMLEKVNKTVSRGDRKDDFIISLIADIGGTLEDESIKFIKDRLNGARFKDTTTFFAPASQVINEINAGLVDRINIYFDDIGVGFNPLGVALNIEPVIYTKRTGLIGSPEVTDVGLDFKVLLDNSLRINAPVLIGSDTIRSTKGEVPGTKTGELERYSKKYRKYVVKKVIHVGSNRADGPFETRVSSLYEYLKFVNIT